MQLLCCQDVAALAGAGPLNSFKSSSNVGTDNFLQIFFHYLQLFALQMEVNFHLSVQLAIRTCQISFQWIEMSAGQFLFSAQCCVDESNLRHEP